MLWEVRMKFKLCLFQLRVNFTHRFNGSSKHPKYLKTILQISDWKVNSILPLYCHDLLFELQESTKINNQKNTLKKTTTKTVLL